MIARSRSKKFVPSARKAATGPFHACIFSRLQAPKDLFVEVKVLGVSDDWNSRGDAVLWSAN